MDNQQETVSEVEKGWLAGIIDGEGSISINRLLSHGTNITYTCRIQVPNTNVLITNKVQSIFNRLNVKGSTEKRQFGKKEWKTCYIITLNSAQQACALLPLIIPYLVGKREHAEVLYQFVSSRIESKKNRSQKIIFDKDNHMVAGTRSDKYSEEEINCYKKLVVLNKKGKEIGSSETTR